MERDLQVAPMFRFFLLSISGVCVGRSADARVSIFFAFRSKAGAAFEQLYEVRMVYHTTQHMYFYITQSTKARPPG
jgi:hypothetical protein